MMRVLVLLFLLAIMKVNLQHTTDSRSSSKKATKRRKTNAKPVPDSHNQSTLNQFFAPAAVAKHRTLPPFSATSAVATSTSTSTAASTTATATTATTTAKTTVIGQENTAENRKRSPVPVASQDATTKHGDHDDDSRKDDDNTTVHPTETVDDDDDDDDGTVSTSSPRRHDSTRGGHARPYRTRPSKGVSYKDQDTDDDDNDKKAKATGTQLSSSHPFFTTSTPAAARTASADDEEEVPTRNHKDIDSDSDSDEQCDDDDLEWTPTPAENRKRSPVPVASQGARMKHKHGDHDDDSRKDDDNTTVHPTETMDDDDDDDRKVSASSLCRHGGTAAADNDNANDDSALIRAVLNFDWIPYTRNGEEKEIQQAMRCHLKSLRKEHGHDWRPVGKGGPRYPSREKILNDDLWKDAKNVASLPIQYRPPVYQTEEYKEHRRQIHQKWKKTKIEQGLFCTRCTSVARGGTKNDRCRGCYIYSLEKILMAFHPKSNYSGMYCDPKDAVSLLEKLIHENIDIVKFASGFDIDHSNDDRGNYVMQINRKTMNCSDILVDFERRWQEYILGDVKVRTATKHRMKTYTEGDSEWSSEDEGLYQSRKEKTEAYVKLIPVDELREFFAPILDRVTGGFDYDVKKFARYCLPHWKAKAGLAPAAVETVTAAAIDAVTDPAAVEAVTAAAAAVTAAAVTAAIEAVATPDSAAAIVKAVVEAVEAVATPDSAAVSAAVIEAVKAVAADTDAAAAAVTAAAAAGSGAMEILPECAATAKVAPAAAATNTSAKQRNASAPKTTTNSNGGNLDVYLQANAAPAAAPAAAATNTSAKKRKATSAKQRKVSAPKTTLDVYLQANAAPALATAAAVATTNTSAKKRKVSVPSTTSKSNVENQPNKLLAGWWGWWWS